MTHDNEEKRPQDDATQAAPQEAQPETKNNRYIAMTRIDLVPKPGYVLRKVGQAYMIMPTGPRMKDYQGMITLNETGAFLYKEIEKPEPSVEKLQQACIAEYGATQEEAAAAVQAFMQQCAECGLLGYETKVFDTVERREVHPDELRDEE